MSGKREPTDLLLYKGKKHLTKEEIKERKASEIKAPSDKIYAPAYLLKKQKDEFDSIACQLIEIGIMTNLDCDSLASFILAKSDYIRFMKMSRKSKLEISELEALSRLKDKAFKQARAAASDLGLTISSRCKLTIPKKHKPQVDDESKPDKTEMDNFLDEI